MGINIERIAGIEPYGFQYPRLELISLFVWVIFLQEHMGPHQGQ